MGTLFIPLAALQLLTVQKHTCHNQGRLCDMLSWSAVLETMCCGHTEREGLPLPGRTVGGVLVRMKTKLR